GALDFKLPLVLQAEAAQSIRFAPREFAGPRTPSCPSVHPAHDLKQHEVFQPPGELLLEILEAVAVSVVLLQKTLRGLAQEWELAGLDFVKVDPNACCRRQLHAVKTEPAVFREAFQTDEERIARERRRRRVRGVVQPWRRKR